MIMTSRDIAELLESPSDQPLDFSCSRVASDSRHVASDTLFVALQGEHVDGHDFADRARDAGAVAVLGQRRGLREIAGLPYFCVQDARRALGLIAHRLAGDASKDLTVLGVTGTNGKSSTVYLIGQILRTCGYSAAQFGTIGNCIGGETNGAVHTTPFAEDLARLFRRARDAQHTHVVMEVSSHALEQERVAGIDFDAAVFTNLTQDHLDYHQDMQSYLREKIKLFDRIEGPGRFTVVNLEDPSGGRFLEASRVPCYTFGADGDCRALNVQAEARRTLFDLITPWGQARISLKLLGLHNVSNALAAITACGAAGAPLEAIAEGVADLSSVPGRFEHIDVGQDFQVIVDYAHTEDGLRNVLCAARQLCKGRVIVVFGCGGDRDKGKRPKMAATAAELSDFCIVTSDNPRTESPERILLDVEVGLQGAGKKRDDDYLVFIEREAAIERALDMARRDDLVLIAGKGHEDYQILDTGRIHFDDREVARSMLEAR